MRPNRNNINDYRVFPAKTPTITARIVSHARFRLSIRLLCNGVGVAIRIDNNTFEIRKKSIKIVNINTVSLKRGVNLTYGIR
jgi:hypothetical protein